jgi:hypothetical protein
MFSGWPLTRAKTEKWGFRKHWMSNDYRIGDLYQDGLQERYRESWKTEPPDAGPYLQHLKTLSSEWPQFRLLADFMEVGICPSRLQNVDGNRSRVPHTYPKGPNLPANISNERERLTRTNVRQLNYLTDGSVQPVGTYKNPTQLLDALTTLDALARNDVELSLFVVEDLSREVIEKLGYHFDIDPDFFLAHIFDYAWYNIRDSFWSPPSLHMDALHRDWFQIRFCRARYFSTTGLFEKGQKEGDMFKIGRRLLDDENKAIWDRSVPPKAPKAANKWFAKPTTSDEEAPLRGSQGVLSPGNNADENEGQKQSQDQADETIDGKVGLMRTRATFWRRRWEKSKCDVGILLLDPTIKEGFQLWRGYKNWSSPPSIRSSKNELAASLRSSRVPSLTRSDGEDKVERSLFEDFMFWTQKPNEALQQDPGVAFRLPIMVLFRLACGEWLTLSQYIKTRLSQIDWEITHPKEFLSQTRIDFILRKLHTWRRLIPMYREMLLETRSGAFQWLDATEKPQDRQPRVGDDPWDTYKAEFTLILRQMEEFEERIDRLTTVVTSAISIVDSRRVERLSLLATLFVPLSLVSSLFAMSEDIARIKWTYLWWAIASIVLTAVLLVWTWRTRSRQGK